MANLSLETMEHFIPKIDKLIEELQGFDVHKISVGNEPLLCCLSDKINSLITDVYGNSTHEYYKYHSISQITYLNMSIHRDIGQVRDIVNNNLQLAILTLENIKSNFNDKLQGGAASKQFVTDEEKRYWLGGLHPKIREVVERLFLNGHYAEAVRNSTIVLEKMVQEKSGCTQTGVSLMQHVFSEKNPWLLFNNYESVSEKDEHKGLMFIFSGAVMAIRNPKAHEICKNDSRNAMDEINIISALARKLDMAACTENQTLKTAGNLVDIPA